MCILKTLPHMCISHALFMHTHLLPLSCLGLYLISSSLACYVYFMFCRIFFFKVFCLLFELYFSFILHPSCIIIIVCFFISCPHFSLTLCPFLTKRGEYTLESIPKCFVISIWLFCTSLGGENLFLMHICRGRVIS